MILSVLITFVPQTLHWHVMDLTPSGKSFTLTIFVLLLGLHSLQVRVQTLLLPSLNFSLLHLICILQTSVATHVRLAGCFLVTK